MNGVDSEGARGVVLRPRGPSLWATAILTPLPGQTTKITFCIVFNAVGHFFWAYMNAHGGEAARGGIPGAVTVSRCRCSCPRRRENTMKMW